MTYSKNSLNQSKDYKIEKKIIVMLFFLFSITSQATDIKMKTENYPPYSMEVDGELQGLSVDILESMLQQMGSIKNKSDVELTSWSDAYSWALNNKNGMVLVATMTKSRRNLFKWVGPISKTTIGVISLKNKSVVIKNVLDLNKYKIGTIKKDIGETLLLENGINKNNMTSIDGTNSLATLFYKLEREKIDMMAYETKVAMYSADLNGFESDKFEVIYTLANNELYFAFNKQTPDKTIQKWQKALDSMKSNGTYDKILKKY